MSDAALTSALPSALPSAERVRALAEAVLARPAYADYRRDPTELQSLVARLAEWLEAHLGWLPDRIDQNAAYWKDLFVRLVDAIFADGPVALILRVAVAVAVLTAVGWAVLALVRALRERGDASAGGTVRAPSRRAWIEEADALSAEGRFLEAAHCTQLASLELLLQREWVTLERSDPNETLRRRIDSGRMPRGLRADFLALLDRLESRWFRDRSEDRELYDAWRGLFVRIDEAVA